MSAEGIIGGDICQLGLQPDYINVTCSVNYNGNIAPKLTWHDARKGILSPDTSMVTLANNHLRFDSSVVVQVSKQMNGSTFTCYAKMIWNSNNSTSQKYTQELNITWRSPVVNLLCMYANKHFSIIIPI